MRQDDSPITEPDVAGGYVLLEEGRDVAHDDNQDEEEVRDEGITEQEVDEERQRRYPQRARYPPDRYQAGFS